MADAMNAPEVDIALVAVRIAEVPCLQRSARLLSLADDGKLIDVSLLDGLLDREETERIALPCWQVRRPRNDAGKGLCFSRHPAAPPQSFSQPLNRLACFTLVETREAHEVSTRDGNDTRIP